MYVCLSVSVLLHIEYIFYPTIKVIIFLGGDNILDGPHNFKGLFEG